MAGTPNLQVTSLAQAVEMFKKSFYERYPNSRFLIDGEGYEDENLDLDIYIDGDQLELETYAVKGEPHGSASTGYFILPFVLPAVRYEANGIDN